MGHRPWYALAMRSALGRLLLLVLAVASGTASALIFSAPRELDPEGTNPNFTFADDDVASDRAGTWIAYWARMQAFPGAEAQAIRIARSVDAGRTWAPAVTLIEGHAPFGPVQHHPSAAGDASG